MTPASTTLPPVAESVPLARGFLRGALQALDAAGAADDAEMLVSELATNAVLHARTEFTVTVSREADAVRVRVHDLSRALPRQRGYDVESTTGRGMRLMASLASAWGVEREGAGKVVWFELPASGGQLFVPAWDDIDVDDLLASYDDADAETQTPRRAPQAAA